MHFIPRHINLLYRLQLCYAVFVFSFLGCKKLVDIDPPTSSVNEANVYKTDGTAIAVLNGIYSSMIGNGNSTVFNGDAGISLLTGLSSDELTLFNGVANNKLIAYYKNALLAAGPMNNYGSEFWAGSGGPGLYYYIFICNAAIEGLSKSTTLTPSIQQQLLGEAKFLRAFFYFYLVNLYGDVPLTLTTDPAANAVIPRTSSQLVYAQIINDLKDAKNLLSPNFRDGNLNPYSGSPEKVRPTVWAAFALLARVYLYKNEYANAEQEASFVINQTALFNLSAVNNCFLKNSSEAIWQIQPVASGRNTEEAFTFILPATGPNSSINPVYLSSQQLNSFETGDQRKANWVDSVTPTVGITYYFANKYKATVASGAPAEYLMMFRLGEQYLIRAEARAQQNNFSGTKSDLNTIRTRAGLSNTTANDKSSLLTAILQERQVELFAESGHRWFDLKRTNNVEAVMGVVTALKGGTWQTTDQLYPIPVSDIIKNPNLKQNAGY